MNRVIQLILFIILIVIIYVFYDLYFKENKKTKVEKKLSIDNPVSTSEPTNSKENNLIKNLTYEINIREDNDYLIKSELSEITYKNGSELILMQNVTAILTDKNYRSLYVTSDNANYNNSNYNTSFESNVEIRFLNNVIFADNMVLDFKTNYISVLNNVRYNGSLGNLEADNIKINLITKKIDIFMNNNSENVVITSSK